MWQTEWKSDVNLSKQKPFFITKKQVLRVDGDFIFLFNYCFRWVILKQQAKINTAKMRCTWIASFFSWSFNVHKWTCECLFVFFFPSSWTKLYKLMNINYLSPIKSDNKKYRVLKNVNILLSQLFKCCAWSINKINLLFFNEFSFIIYCFAITFYQLP